MNIKYITNFFSYKFYSCYSTYNVTILLIQIYKFLISKLKIVMYYFFDKMGNRRDFFCIKICTNIKLQKRRIISNKLVK